MRSIETEEITDMPPLNGKRIIYHLLKIIPILFFFLLSIDLLSSGFTLLGKDAAKGVISLTSNPFISLFIGLLITTIIQSSSTSTSMIVAVTASGSIELKNAIPMIMGANIGTTLTSTIVALAFITKKKEFRKALSAGISHDFFNVLLTLILFPLEYYYNFLSIITRWFTSMVAPAIAGDNASGVDYEFPFTSGITHLLNDLIDNPIIILIIAIVLLFGTIKILSKQIYKLLRGEFSHKLREHLKQPFTSFAWGTMLTAAVQSSSITTSLLVPVVATGKISLRKAFPFIMGANIGTTITALLAALFKSEAAISIAIAHLLFNLIGVLIFLPFARLRNIPIFLAREVGKQTMKYRVIGFVYIILTFFLIPFILIYLNKI
jgi:solute carrier family 34 (sodium-dependent phosphate cotransporter)